MLDGVFELIGFLFQVLDLVDLMQFLWTVFNLIGETISLGWQCLRWLAGKVATMLYAGAPERVRSDTRKITDVVAWQKKPQSQRGLCTFDDVQ